MYIKTYFPAMVIICCSSCFLQSRVWPLLPTTSVQRCSMTLTVSRGEGLTIITVTSNPKSKWPVLCEILGFLCYSPACFVSQGMKGKLKDILTALGVSQALD